MLHSAHENPSRARLAPLVLLWVVSACYEPPPEPPPEPQPESAVVEPELVPLELSSPRAALLQLAKLLLYPRDPDLVPGGDSVSPNGKYRTSSKRAGRYLRTIYVAEQTPGAAPRPVVTLEESDPGSGQLYFLTWTSDSRALLIQGVSLVAGLDESARLPLLYVPATDALHTQPMPTEAELTAGRRRWRSGDVLERGRVLPCVQGLHGWSTEAVVDALGAPDERDSRFLYWSFDLGPEHDPLAGEYRLRIDTGGEGLVERTVVRIRTR